MLPGRDGRSRASRAAHLTTHPTTQAYPMSKFNSKKYIGKGWDGVTKGRRGGKWARPEEEALPVLSMHNFGIAACVLLVMGVVMRTVRRRRLAARRYATLAAAEEDSI